MRAVRRPGGRLLVPRRAEGPGGVLGDGWVEIGPDDPEYTAWAADLSRREASDTSADRSAALRAMIDAELAGGPANSK